MHGSDDLMVKVIHLADDGKEVASIEVDDFTIEVIYSGLADLLREAAVASRAQDVPPSLALPLEARRRRNKILERIRDRLVRAPRAGTTGAVTCGERGRYYAEASCPATWQTFSLLIGPATSRRTPVGGLVEEAKSVVPAPGLRGRAPWCGAGVHRGDQAPLAVEG